MILIELMAKSALKLKLRVDVLMIPWKNILNSRRIQSIYFDKICDLEISKTPILCPQRNVPYIDFDEDETKCKAAVLLDASKKCNYKSNNTVGQKCYEEEIEAKYKWRNKKIH